jgi:hypothetical protein
MRRSHTTENLPMMRWMLVLFVLGAVSLGAGLHLLWFTPAATDWGFEGIILVVTLITVGLFLLVPAKIYVILRFTRRT